MPAPRTLATGVSLFVLFLATTLPADTPAPPAPQAVATVQASAPTAPPAAVTHVRRASPMMLEVRAALEREREQIEALRVRLRQATGRREALELQREIERVKLDTEVAVLRIQADAARKAGHAALAERLDAAIANLLVPPAAVTPATRPAPRGASR